MPVKPTANPTTKPTEATQATVMPTKPPVSSTAIEPVDVTEAPEVNVPEPLPPRKLKKLSQIAKY